jgi:hypothetical protein
VLAKQARPNSTAPIIVGPASLRGREPLRP